MILSLQKVGNGEKELLDLFHRLEKPDKRKLMRGLGSKQKILIVDGLRRGEAVGGGRITPSARAQRDGGATLIDKGHMIGNLTVQRVTDSTAIVGFSSRTEGNKGFWHQHGTRRMIARPWFGMRRGDKEALVKVGLDWLKKTLGGKA